MELAPVTDGDRDPVFYYSRASRLSRSVNDEQSKKTGLFKTSAAARANIMLFVSIIIICVMFGISTRISGKQGVNLGGNTITLTLVREEGVLILNIFKKAPKSGEVYMGAVDISVSPAEPTAASQIFSHRITLNPAATETYRVSLPFDGNDFFVTLRAGEEKSLRVKF